MKGKRTPADRDLSDEQVMKGIQSGRVEMLAILFERHHVKLFNFFLRLCGNRVRSEDLVQDVFVRILKYNHTYRETGPFVFWMYQIARRVHLDSARRDQAVSSLEDTWQEPRSREANPDEATVLESETRMLRRALSELPEKKREALVLSRFHDFKYREIAEMMNCTVSTVKILVHRGIKDLRRIYGGIKGGVQ